MGKGFRYQFGMEGLVYRKRFLNLGEFWSIRIFIKQGLGYKYIYDNWNQGRDWGLEIE